MHQASFQILQRANVFYHIVYHLFLTPPLQWLWPLASRSLPIPSVPHKQALCSSPDSFPHTNPNRTRQTAILPLNKHPAGSHNHLKTRTDALILSITITITITITRGEPSSKAVNMLRSNQRQDQFSETRSG